MPSGAFPSEYQEIVDDKIQDTGKAHGQQVAQHHVPTCESFNEQQRSEPEEEDSGTGKVVCKIQFEEPSYTGIRSVARPVLPHIEIGYGEIDSHRTLKGYQG